MSFVYADVSVANLGQQQEVDSAKLSGPQVSIPGLGESAIVYETVDPKKSQTRFTAAIQDSNFRMVIYLSAFTNNGDLSDAKRTDLRNSLTATAKASYPKFTAGLKK